MSKKSGKNNTPQKEQRGLLHKSDDTEYGLVVKKLGSGRFSIRLNMQNKEVIGRLCGKFRKGSSKKNNWVDIDSVVLVGMRDYQDNIVDIIHIYDQTEVRLLKKSGEFVEESVRENTEDSHEQYTEEENFDFEDV